MNRFWECLIQPVLCLNESKNIVEIGSFSGLNTNKLIEFTRTSGGILYSIDPDPKYDTALMKQENNDHFICIKELSLSALPLIEDYDAVLIDGDHNWYTVYHELKIIEHTFKKNSKRFPVLFVHDIDWPYGRRDMYYNPENIPFEFRQPYKQSGLVPGKSSLDPTGINSQMLNSVYENNPRNGVLTAIEDFLNETSFELEFFKLHGFYGIGVIIPSTLKEVSNFMRSSTLYDCIATRLETDRINQLRYIKEIKDKTEEKDNRHKKEIGELSQEIDYLQRNKLELLGTNEELNEKLVSLSTEKNQIEIKLQEVENDLSLLKKNQVELESIYQSTCELLEKTKKERNRFEEEEKHYRYAATTHISSIRYQLGDALISSVDHPKNLIKLPIKLIKIMGRAIQKKRKPTQPTSDISVQSSTEHGSINELAYESVKSFKDKYFRENLEEYFSNNKISIIIPVFNALEDFKLCIESVLKHTKITYELIIVNDCSTDPRVNEYLSTFSNDTRFSIIENESNKGYVESVNVGINASQYDVVLLNSDTIVTHRWLQKLRAAAYSNSKIGTVTPFSNAAGAFSVPVIGVVNEIPTHLTLDSMAKLVEYCSSLDYPEVPTGNGFCMYIKRKLIQDIGGMDSIQFHRGYGEENDFCMRALKAGWINIIDDSTFIYHKRSASFSDEKNELMKNNRATLDKLHPEYTDLVSEFINSSLLRKIRDNITKAIESPSINILGNQKRILYVLHQGSGGTPNTNKDLMNYIEKGFECFVLTSNTKVLRLFSYKDKDFSTIKEWKLPEPWKITDFTRNDYEEIYFNILSRLNIDIVHIRHLLAHTFDIAYLSNKLGLKVVLSFHDFYFVCPSIHLLDNENKYCAGQCSSGTGVCQIPSNWIREGLPDLKNQWINVWREKVRDLIEECSAFVTTSKTSKEVYTTTYPILNSKHFEVIEHGREEEISSLEKTDYYETPKKGELIKILLPGNIDNHKGLEFIKKLKMQDRSNCIEFHFMGKVDESLIPYGINHGAYKRDEFYSIVGKIKPSFVGIFSIWPETYCHTLSEAWICGIPVLATRIGTIEERILNTGGGWFLDFNDAKKSYDMIIELSEDISGYKKMVNVVKEIQIRNAEEMSRDYSFLYSQLLYGMNLKRVALFTKKGIRGFYNPSGYIRSILPLTHPKTKEYLHLEVLDTDIINSPEKMGSFDTVIVQRDCLDYNATKKLSEICSDKRLIFEIDDDFLSIDQSHPEYDLYKEKNDTIRLLLEEADDVTVSSPILKDRFSEYNSNITVIPNVLDERIWYPHMINNDEHNFKKSIDIVYIGSNTHSGDLELIRPAVERIKKWGGENGYIIEFYIVGGSKNDAEWYKKIIVPKGLENYIDFIKWIKEVNTFTFAVAPLVDSKINNAKSYLKYLDYSALGLPGIYSDRVPFKSVITNRANGLLCDSDDEWFQAMKEFIEDPSFRNQIRINIENDMKSNYLLKEKYQQWVNVLYGD